MLAAFGAGRTSCTTGALQLVAPHAARRRKNPFIGCGFTVRLLQPPVRLDDNKSARIASVAPDLRLLLIAAACSPDKRLKLHRKWVSPFGKANHKRIARNNEVVADRIPGAAGKAHLQSLNPPKPIQDTHPTKTGEPPQERGGSPGATYYSWQRGTESTAKQAERLGQAGAKRTLQPQSV